MPKKQRKKETRNLWKIFTVTGIVVALYSLLDFSCRQPVVGTLSKAESLFLSECTIPLSNVILFGIGIFLFAAGLYARK